MHQLKSPQHQKNLEIANINKSLGVSKKFKRYLRQVDKFQPGETPEILVVDDQPESLALLERILSGHGLNVRVAPTAALGLQSILLKPPTLILLDVSLPDQTGFEFCEQLQADPTTSHIPVIFLSAHDEIRSKAKGFRVGGVDFISKPFETVELLARIQNQLKVQVLWRRLQKRNEHQQNLLNEHRCLKQLLFQEKELAEVTLQSIGDAVVTTDAQGLVSSINPLAAKLLQIDRHEAEGQPIEKLFRLYDERSHTIINNPVMVALESGEVVSFGEESILVNEAGTEFSISDSAAPIRDRSGSIIGAVMVFRDVTEARQMARRLSWQATHDPLTNLFNRSELERQLITVMKQVHRQEHTATLCYLDLDRFKVVNDTCGHKAGDELLRQVTLMIQQQITTQDIFARVGGDEFALILLNRTATEAEALAHVICEAVQQFRFVWQAQTFKIGVSIGIVHLDEAHRDTTDVINCADAACYCAKEQGRNQVQVYREDIQAFTQRRVDTRWISRLNLALEEARFCLYGQAIMALQPPTTNQPMNMGTGLIPSHQEVLIRMIDEDGEIVPPMSFIPAAERYDLMPEIDLWVVKNFLRYYGQKCQQENPGRYTINLSGASINKPKFVDALETILWESSVPSESICFEITETAAIANLTSAAKSIRQIKKLGCQFALDDFGSGMSSLTYLKHLPVDYLKIDGSFVRQIVKNPVDRAMVEGFNRIAHVMNLKTIAEYVETPEILQVLRSLGVDYAQGDAVGLPHMLFIDKLN
ncbi:EAL domain-containing protein [filamentous cyanobacterium LEGE 11480]|uniref:EAL domain-containing protein n=1 Tax=Romeriopsis navalis LEGE 11480 TaxID=2777977 RepID=A0A928Z264_9CYAN|nr:EAL domain-containing protein [Romeriopsis navalis]MBE9030076.1 EAL domain-containing protein [Romeriopsis navalis LEGE 11480]